MKSESSLSDWKHYGRLVRVLVEASELVESEAMQLWEQFEQDLIVDTVQFFETLKRTVVALGVVELSALVGVDDDVVAAVVAVVPAVG